MEWLMNPQSVIALITLTALEIVLGIDNIIFISVLVSRLPHKKRNKARVLGLGLAMFTRIALLLSITWVMKLTAPLFTVFAEEISGRDMILIVGGLFLLWKSTMEIHKSLEGEGEAGGAKAAAGFAAILAQIAVLDIIFSLDSVITAVGMARELAVMITAVVIAVIVMMLAATPLSEFVQKHPTVKILALSFLLLIGMSLIVEGLHQHISKGYIYFAMGFSVFVEMINLRLRGKSEPVALHEAHLKEDEGSAKAG